MAYLYFVYIHCFCLLYKVLLNLKWLHSIIPMLHWQTPPQPKKLSWQNFWYHEIANVQFGATNVLSWNIHCWDNFTNVASSTSDASASSAPSAVHLHTVLCSLICCRTKHPAMVRFHVVISRKFKELEANNHHVFLCWTPDVKKPSLDRVVEMQFKKWVWLSHSLVWCSCAVFHSDMTYTVDRVLKTSDLSFSLSVSLSLSLSLSVSVSVSLCLCLSLSLSLFLSLSLSQSFSSLSFCLPLIFFFGSCSGLPQMQKLRSP